MLFKNLIIFILYKKMSIQIAQVINIPVVAREIKIEETLTKGKDFKNHRNIFSQDFITYKIYNIIYAFINFCLTIGALLTLIKNNIYYVSLALDICPYQYNLSSYTTFWCEIGDLESSILGSYLVFIVLYLTFEIFSILVHKDITKVEIKGILYDILFGFNGLFVVIFYIYIPLFFYLLPSNVLCMSLSPLDVSSSYYRPSEHRKYTTKENNWVKNLKNPIINTALIFFLFVFNLTLRNRIKSSLIIYLSMKFVKAPKDNIETKKILISGNEVEFKVKCDKILYLKTISDFKVYKFKKVKIPEYNDYIYVNLDHKGFEDLLSFPALYYPDVNEILLKLIKIAEIIFGIYFLSIPLMKMNLNEIQITNLYGGYQRAINISRIVLYSISLFIIFFFMLKTIYFGGFGKSNYKNIPYYLSIFFILDNIIFFILSGIGTVLGVFSVIHYFEQGYSMNDDMLISKIFIHTIFNFIIFFICIGLLIHSSILCRRIRKVKTIINNINSNIDGDNGNIAPPPFSIQYTGFDTNTYILEQLNIPGHPKNAYYISKKINLVAINAQNNLINNQNIPIIINNPLGQNIINNPMGQNIINNSIGQNIINNPMGQNIINNQNVPNIINNQNVPNIINNQNVPNIINNQNVPNIINNQIDQNNNIINVNIQNNDNNQMIQENNINSQNNINNQIIPEDNINNQNNPNNQNIQNNPNNQNIQNNINEQINQNNQNDNHNENDKQNINENE